MQKNKILDIRVCHVFNLEMKYDINTIKRHLLSILTVRSVITPERTPLTISNFTL